MTCLLFAVLLSLCASASSATQFQRPDVILEVTVPNAATPQLCISEGHSGVIDLPGVGKFTFIPNVNEDETSVALQILDSTDTAERLITRVDVTVAAPVRQTRTSPQFGVRVARLVRR